MANDGAGMVRIEGRLRPSYNRAFPWIDAEHPRIDFPQ
jgi:hypothetical protein